MPRPAVLVASTLALAAPACGGASAQEAHGGRVTVVLDDYALAPQRVEAPGGSVRVTAVNRGRINHTLVIERRAKLVQSLKPGARGGLVATLEPGEYRMLCIIGNHEELGMWGTLQVR